MLRGSIEGIIIITRTLTQEPHTACRKGGWGLAKIEIKKKNNWKKKKLKKKKLKKKKFEKK